MNILRNRRYYFRFLFSTVTILIIFTSLLVTGIYFNMKNYIADMEKNKNELILSQMRYNLEYINEMIRDIWIKSV